MRKLVVTIICFVMMLACGSTIALANSDVSAECQHDFYEYEEQAATCETDGIWCSECLYCGYQERLTIPAIGHSFSDWEVEFPATCEDEGEQIQFCQNEGCEEVKYEVIPALGHTYETTTVKARPYEDGYIETICYECGDWLEDIYIDAPDRIKLSNTSYTYNGKSKKPTVKVYDNCGNLISSKHYTVNYEKGRKNVGKYKVTVTFKSSSKKYSGKMSTSFKIKPKATSITTLTKGSKAFTVKWKKGSNNITGYQIKYSKYSDMSNAGYKTIKSKSKVSAKVSGLKADQKYYVQIRTYKSVNGTKYYSSWSKKKNIRTKTAPSSYSDDDDYYAGPIYITRTGECYHTHACGNGTYYRSTLAEARARGLRPCQKCF